MAQDAMRHTEGRLRLGRGLAALLGDSSSERSPLDRSKGVRLAPIEFLRPNSRNPRKVFFEAELDELATSIRERGIIQPILVRAIGDATDSFEIIAGERRWRAAQRAGQHEVPILVLEVGDREALEIALIENVQRTDLNALEEAAGYSQLATDHGYNQSEIARVVGKSRSHIANTLRLVNLPEHSRALLVAGAISAGHARALLAVANPDVVADRVVAQGLTVRDVEKLGDRLGKLPRDGMHTYRIDPDTRALEDKLSGELGTKVAIRHFEGSGEIRIAFRTFEQLDGVVRRLTKTT